MSDSAKAAPPAVLRSPPMHAPRADEPPRPGRRIAALERRPSSEFSLSNRYHIVLVPGFAGFDALGQVEYYAGVTSLFQTWSDSAPAVLHYFDNLPTAAVRTRAKRLCAYLAKRIVRGEILDGDKVVLVGHSTGGLDIRQLMRDLYHRPA